ncbi:hypothetical protein GGQ74_003020 [Desulfobaculum xiamenense]|uniref:Glycosyl transferase family 2 n=1 Tax=Desulfobaculum xiamenense TaxID=995050 RepID=A0A846QSH9_9BACT|nr:glycosyltransferase family 2 protein [Desulfobaculum xiamenense]NJB69323.1 hypothetical protein [Desulfobaculum xiamenense]
MQQPITFSIITPSGGRRPQALRLAMGSVAEALTRLREAIGPSIHIEMLVGFDGMRGPRLGPDGGPPPDFVRFFDLPRDGDYGNAVRNTLLRAARGGHVLFLDDDNALTPEALCIYHAHLDHEMIVARIDTSRAFADVPLLPRVGDDRELVRPTNIDPLCVCVSRELAVVRCGGWTSRGGYEADYTNIFHYWRRAKSRRVLDAVVGVYDAGRGLDTEGVNWRQAASPD